MRNNDHIQLICIYSLSSSYPSYAVLAGDSIFKFSMDFCKP